MNVRHLAPSVSRLFLSTGSLIVAAGLLQPVDAQARTSRSSGASSRSTLRRWENPGPPPATARNHGASGARTRARAVASWTATIN